MKNLTLEILLYLGFFILGFSSSVITLKIIDSDDVNVIGFYVSDSTTEGVKLLGNIKRYRGDWVCIDAGDMESYKEIVEVCSHEVAHHIYQQRFEEENEIESEIFAEFCEDNITKCIDGNWLRWGE